MNGKFEKAKKVLALSLSALMLLSGAVISASAAETDPLSEVFVRPSVENVEYEQVGANYVYVTVTSANSANDEPVMAYISDEAGRLKTVAYSGMRMDSATLKLGLPDSAPTGTYTVSIALNKSGEVYSAEVYYVDVESVNGFFEAINKTGVEATEIDTALRAYGEALAVVKYSADENGKRVAISPDEYEALTEEAKVAFAEEILSGVNGKFTYLKGSFGPENSERFVKEAFILANYNSADAQNPGEELVDCLYRFDTIIGFDSTDAELYAKIKHKDVLAKAAKTTSAKAESMEELLQVIKCAAGVQLVNEAHWYDVVDVIAANNDLFRVDEDSIAAIKKNTKLKTAFCTEMNREYYTVDEIREAWETSYAAAKKSVASSSGGSSGGSSSGGSSSGGATTMTAGSSYINSNDTLGTKKVITDYYTDMADYAWASDHVLDLTIAGVVSGYGDKTFGPSKNLTRAEFMKMLVNACGLADVTAVCSFEDVSKDAWYYVYIASAEKLGLASGYGNGLFGVNDPITREDAVTLIYRAAKIKGLSVSRYTIGVLPFTDKGDISQYAEEAVKALYGTGLYLDTSDKSQITTFEPKGNASRAFAAVVLDQIYNLK